MHARPEHLEHAASTADRFHPDVVAEVVELVESNDVVVIGMGWNPHVKRATKALSEAGIPFSELSIGNYSAKWKERLAIKMWAGWPTFPMVFVKGALLGGADHTVKAIESGDLARLLE